MPNGTMRAAQIDRSGGPEVLQIRDVPVPTPARGQVLVKVHAAGVNPIDTQLRRLRLGSFPRGTGVDYAGEVAALGPGVDGLEPGQRVWGFLGIRMRRTGAVAEYLVARPEQMAAAPTTIDFVSAAALPAVGLTALQVLRDGLRVQSGQRLLVVGASGGVGSTAVQLGKAMGASVTAVASARNADFCRELGADQVLDYDSIKPGALTGEFDALVDCHGGSARQYHRMVRRGGRAVTMTMKGLPFALLSVLLPGPRMRFMSEKMRRDDMETLVGYVDRGELRPVVEQVYPLSAVQDAHRAVETGHAQGKRVVDPTQ
ncbi:NAD(P)-dependent alcohol dehydrogenase [Streptomyces canus]|uniref:NAD(P)-dependent alcohol dehydrogenase n=1 Tax=Streptomyces canus TaxID=58343 RepID=UPI00367669C3